MKETLKNKPLVIQLGSAIALIGFIVYWSFTIGSIIEDVAHEIEDVNARVDHLSDKYVMMREDISALQLQFSDINARLMTIEAILSRIERKLN